MHEECDICGGSKRIRLPVRARMTFRPADFSGPIGRSEDTARDFACPQCTKPKRERIELFSVATSFNGDLAERQPDYEAHVTRQAVMEAGAAAFRRGMFKVEKRKLSEGEVAFGEAHMMRVTVGFADRGAVEKLEADRKAFAREQIAKVLDDVVRDACKEIAVRGSAYNGTAIHKHQAQDAVDGAAKRAMQKLDDWKPANQ